MTRRTYEIILRLGVYASFLLFFLVDDRTIYPYTVIKQVYFNGLIEILTVFWLSLLIKYPEYRFKKTSLTVSLATFFLVLLVSCLTGVDFQLSFWGDLSRMLGWFSLIHCLFFYFIVITVFRRANDWLILLNLSVAVCAIVALNGLLAGNNISTLGLHSYVAGLMLFGFYFALYLMIKTKTNYWRAVYALNLILMLAGFFYADVSGAQLALAVSLAVSAVMVIILSRNRKIKIISLIAVTLFATIIGLLLIVRTNHIFDHTKVGKIFRDFSYQNINLETRFYAWQTAWSGFKERPILGFGYGAFSYPAEKYFSAAVYQYTIGDEYFDRVHNNLLEIAVTSGLIGLAAYLAIFVAVGFLLVRIFLAGKINAPEAAALVAILTAYIINNLALFDALPSYVYLMVTLAYVYYLNSAPMETAVDKQKSGLTDKETIVLCLGAILMIIVVYQYNVKIYRLAYQTGVIIEASKQDSADYFMVNYQSPFVFHTPLDRFARSAFIDNIINQAARIASLPMVARQKLYQFSLSLADKDMVGHERNYPSLYRKALLLTVIGEDAGDKKYWSEALATINQALTVSHNHIPPYILKANIQQAMGQTQDSADTLKQALIIAPNYYQLYCYLAKVQIKLPNKKEAQKNQTVCDSHLSEAERP